MRFQRPCLGNQCSGQSCLFELATVVEMRDQEGTMRREMFAAWVGTLLLVLAACGPAAQQQATQAPAATQPAAAPAATSAPAATTEPAATTADSVAATGPAGANPAASPAGGRLQAIKS